MLKTYLAAVLDNRGTLYKQNDRTMFFSRSKSNAFRLLLFFSFKGVEWVNVRWSECHQRKSLQSHTHTHTNSNRGLNGSKHGGAVPIAVAGPSPRPPAERGCHNVRRFRQRHISTLISDWPASPGSAAGSTPSSRHPDGTKKARINLS
jgi:hypothetical protein